VDLDVVFLGTSASGPTAQRSASALLVRRGGERLLFDCGEGTQRQLLRSSVGLVDLPEVFLTHYHADHFLGLPGMLKTFALRARELPLAIYGPPGLRDLFAAFGRIVGRLPYPLELVEVRAGDALDRGEYRLLVFPTEHGVSSVGYALAESPRPGRFDVAAADARGVPAGRERGRLQHGEPVTLADGRTIAPEEVLGPPRPGRTVLYTGDTAPSEVVRALAEGADLLVHEATFAGEDADRAAETMHSTAAQAAEVARDAGVRMLALTHVSPRYFGPDLVEEAGAIFGNTVVPRDFDLIEVPFEERGEPTLVKSGARPARGQERVAEATAQ
jgi:ribonuclease Z